VLRTRRRTSAAVLASRDDAGAAMAPSTAMVGPSRALCGRDEGWPSSVVWSGLASDFKYRAVEQSSELGFEDELAKLLVMCRITTRLSVVRQRNTLDKLCNIQMQTSYVRGDIPFLPVEEPRPAAQVPLQLTYNTSLPLLYVPFGEVRDGVRT